MAQNGKDVKTNVVNKGKKVILRGEYAEKDKKTDVDRGVVIPRKPSK